MELNFDAVIIGSGCSGFAAADRLHSFGITKIAVLTEGINCGTSRNAGSDKQTYYKLSTSGNVNDSVQKMAKSLFDGGAMDGSHAVLESANSLRCFMYLVEKGVPFPTNQFGEFIGYKTDHDNTSRASSCGPLTSKLMTEQLQKAVFKNNTPIIDNARAIKIVKNGDKIIGVFALNINATSMQDLFVFIKTPYVILASGGEAAIYNDSVYPKSQIGGSGLAAEVGAEFCNLQEWQYGIASTKFRWNLSGSYQQVIPRYVSVDSEGNECEFLLKHYKKVADCYNNVFLKGYQWPFDSAKVNHSSRIDLLVKAEIDKGNKVYLDYTANPFGFDINAMNSEAKEYFKSSNCYGNLPIDRLLKLNPKAYDLYLANDIDLKKEYLEIAVCSQHNNGGIYVDDNFETSVKNLFAIGECAGIFGIYRAGGSALNNTQVSALRVAEYIKNNGDFVCDYDENLVKAEHKKLIDFVKASLCDDFNCLSQRKNFAVEMSKIGAFDRELNQINCFAELLDDYMKKFNENNKISKLQESHFLFENLDIFTFQNILAKTISESIKSIGSRGGSVSKIGDKIIAENIAYRHKLTITKSDGSVCFKDCNCVPKDDRGFEIVWQEYIKSYEKIEAIKRR